MNFRVDTRQEAGTLVFAFVGEFDLAAAESIPDPWPLDGLGAVEADVCGVEFMDSSGLHALLKLKAQVEKAGQRFWVRCTPVGPAARVFELSGLKPKLTIVVPGEAAEEVAS
jgi:anti-anti-sigma factor